MTFRVGFGLDIHKLEAGLPLIIGTVDIPHIQGIVAHSDGDVLLHAICDAMLGAAGLNDIGHFFPDTDPSIRGISSSLILLKTMQLVKDQGYQLVNIDTTLVAQQPKLSPYIDQMKAGIAKVLDIDTSQIGIKATTSEKLGYEGREEGITAYAVVLLSKQS
jgi:2-C-methyl-D-erythritol 2,4-cyclodiphosphate synthase